MKTVSRVLNGEAHVRPHLRSRVLAAVEELRYRPNQAARQLVTNKSFFISFIMPSRLLAYMAELVLAASIECRAHGYHLISETLENGEEPEKVIERVTSKLRPDGIILAPPLSNDEKMLAAAARAGIPIVRIGALDQQYGETIAIDETIVASHLVDHLIERGHRRIGIVAPPPRFAAAMRRVDGYRQALDRAGIAFDPLLVVGGEFTFASGARGAADLLALQRRPTAIFAANDNMALGVMAMAARLGFTIPDDLAVAGFDDSQNSRMVFPALTTVRQPVAGMARHAVLRLMGKETAGVDLVHELILRGSTTGSRDLAMTDNDG